MWDYDDDKEIAVKNAGEEYDTFPEDILHVKHELRNVRRDISDLIRGGEFPINYQIKNPQFDRYQAKMIQNELRHRGFDVRCYSSSDFYTHVLTKIEFVIDKNN